MARMRHRCDSGLFRMLEMMVAARDPDQLPAVLFKCPNEVPTVFHTALRLNAGTAMPHQALKRMEVSAFV
jgi:hypothetical protein